MSARGAAVRPARAVFFDLGDTIWHFPRRPPPDVVTAELVRRVETLLNGWGLAADASALQAAIGAAWADADSRADRDEGPGPDYHALTGGIVRQAGLELTPRQIADLWASQNAGGRFLGREVLPDALATLDALRARNLHIGVITNRGHGGAAFLAELEDHGLAGHFETVVSSDQVGYRKPHPRIFGIALERVGVAAHEAVHVGDRPDADVDGARRAGLTAVWMRGVAQGRALPSHLEGAHHAIERLSELLELPVLRAD